MYPPDSAEVTTPLGYPQWGRLVNVNISFYNSQPSSYFKLQSHVIVTLSILSKMLHFISLCATIYLEMLQLVLVGTHYLVVNVGSNWHSHGVTDGFIYLTSFIITANIT